MSQLVSRMIRAARLDASLYEEVEADASATGQAVAVVLLSSLAAGLGSLFAGGFLGLIGGAVTALVCWLLWSFMVFLIGTRLLPGPDTRADYGQLLRTIGFSASPGVIRVIGFTSLLAWLVSLLAGVWMLVAMVIAVRQALDFRETGRAVVVCVLGWLVYLILWSLLGGFLWAGGKVLGF